VVPEEAEEAGVAAGVDAAGAEASGFVAPVALEVVAASGVFVVNDNVTVLAATSGMESLSNFHPEWHPRKSKTDEWPFREWR
jgi:hypothetical protein